MPFLTAYKIYAFATTCMGCPGVAWVFEILSKQHGNAYISDVKAVSYGKFIPENVDNCMVRYMLKPTWRN